MYYEIAKDASGELTRYRELPPESGVFSRLGVWSSVQMNVINRQKTDRMAEVLINGSTEGIIEMMRITNRLREAEPGAVALANRLMAAEQKNILLMQKYL